MNRIFLLYMVLLFSSCSTTRYYVVRHAEKAAPNATMSSDVPLSEAGRKRAEALRDTLSGVSIQQFWTSNTIRTRSTLEPIRAAVNGQLQVYSNDSLDFYITRWKEASGTLLIAGHSNTVDNIVNGLLEQDALKDLPDSQYGDLFVVHKKRTLFNTRTWLDQRKF
jgi:phosphohistidine phosphatase SixA